MAPSGLNDGIVATIPGRIAEANPAASDAAQTTQPQTRASPVHTGEIPMTNLGSVSGSYRRARHPPKGIAMSSLPRLVKFPDIRRALDYADNRSVKKACVRFSIPIVALNSRVLALRQSDFETLLARASGMEIAS
jgi:hypothetical protein